MDQDEPRADGADADADGEPRTAASSSAPPAIAAVPSPRDANVVPIRPPKKEPEPAWGKQIPDAVAGAESDAEDTPRPPGPRGVPGKKPRRELPPYLRVIK